MGQKGKTGKNKMGSKMKDSKASSSGKDFVEIARTSGEGDEGETTNAKQIWGARPSEPQRSHLGREGD